MTQILENGLMKRILNLSSVHLLEMQIVFFKYDNLRKCFSRSMDLKKYK